MNKIARLQGSLAFRLTVWYAGLFTLSSLVAFVAFYLLIASVIHERRDEDLSGDVKEFSELLASEGIDRVKVEMDLEAASDGSDKIFLRLLSHDGEVMASSNMSHWRSARASNGALKKLRAGANRVFETLRLPEQDDQVRVVHGIIGPGTILQLGESLEEDEEFLQVLRRIFIPTLVVSALLASLAGWLMAKRALAGVEEVTQTALHISQGAYDRCVPIKTRGDEIERLATTFNHMVERIDALNKEMREMTDNIAHDLRTPLTRIRGAAEMMLVATCSPDECVSTAASTIEECDHLLGIVNTMLDISECEFGEKSISPEEVDIAGVIRQACELFSPIAEDQGVSIVCELPGSCVFRGDVQKLQRMAANLLDNALRYTPAGGTVAISVTEDDRQVMISVSDTGIGVSEEDLPHIFKRFYRGKETQSIPGVGLGLSLVKAIVRSHGGSISATGSPGRGSTFTVTFPRYQASR